MEQIKESVASPRPTIASRGHPAELAMEKNASAKKYQKQWHEIDTVKVPEEVKKLNPLSYAYDFSKFQVHRQHYTPGTPQALEECDSVPIKLHTEAYPIAEGLGPLFPTLLGKGMSYFELKGDAENGTLAKSERPLNLGCVLSGG